jgi:ribosomal protein L30/L7E
MSLPLTPSITATVCLRCVRRIESCVSWSRSPASGARKRIARYLQLLARRRRHHRHCLSVLGVCRIEACVLVAESSQQLEANAEPSPRHLEAVCTRLTSRTAPPVLVSRI